jgi:hypothetical protein
VTLDEFATISAGRIPTPSEFLEFVSDLGWRVTANDDGTGGIWVPDKNDPLALSLARMFRREPWRTNVRNLVRSKATPAAREPEAKPELKADPEPEEPPPTGRPPDAWTDESHEIVRSGVCRAVRDGWLAWARYKAGRWYWFDECRLPWGSTSVVCFRVFAGADSGWATRAKFAELFAESRG